MEYEFHPASEAYPLMPETELKLLADKMQQHGYDPHFPIALLAGKILDGRNRYRGAALAAVEPIVVVLPDDTDPDDFVEIANEHRRHLTEDWLQQHRRDRVARIAAAHKNGEPTRTIAKKEGVSQTQVMEDLKLASQEEEKNTNHGENSSHSKENQNSEVVENSEVTGEHPPCSPGSDKAKNVVNNGQRNRNGKVTGKDGRKQSSRKKKLFCDRCTRVGAVKDCVQCAILRETANSKKSGRKSSGGSPKTSKNGSPLFDNKKIVAAFSKLVRLLNERALALKQEKSDAYRGIRESVETLLTLWERWITKD